MMTGISWGLSGMNLRGRGEEQGWVIRERDGCEVYFGVPFLVHMGYCDSCIVDLSMYR
jgi:hypothetical protein